MWTIEETDIDGVRAVWVDGPAPLRAELQFRVGVADEPLHFRGFTHLLEHLALTRRGQPSEMLNGRVELDHCAFNIAGDERDIVDFFAQLGPALLDPPGERLDHEARILRAEGSGNGGAFDALLTSRYGARGPGKLAYAEFGLHDVDIDVLRDWARRHFTRENAVLWLSGPPPAGLRLDLPSGSPVELPDLAPRRDLDLPAFQRFGQAVALAFEGSREIPHIVTMTSFAIARMLEERARYQRGSSYQVGSISLRASYASSLEAVFADVSEGRSQSVVDALIEVVDELCDGGDITESKQFFLRQMDHAANHPEGRIGHLAANATRLLHGRQIMQPDEWDEKLRSVTSVEVQEQAHHIKATASFLIPVDAEMPDDAMTLAPEWSLDELSDPIEVYHPHAEEAESRLEVAEDGVALGERSGPRQVVRTEDCQLKLRWHDGAVGVLNSVGGSVVVAPQHWSNGKTAAQLVDEVFSAPAVTVGLRYWIPDGAGPMGLISRVRADLTGRSIARSLPIAFLIMVIAGSLLAGIGITLEGLGLVEGSTPAPTYDVVTDSAGQVTGIIEEQPEASKSFEGETLVSGLAFISVGLVALALLIWRSATRTPPEHRPKLLDRAVAHGDQLPQDVSTHKAYLVGGLMLGWLASREHTSPWLEESLSKSLGEFRAGEITALELYREADGLLATDMANDRVARFLVSYFPRRHGKAIRSIQGDAESLYHLPDTAATLDAFMRRADADFARWERWPIRI